jgi:molybdopterin molybdotransferase
MLEPHEAARRIVEAIRPLPAVRCALTEADGLVLASDVVSPVSLPLWANSAMDGYACKASDIAGATDSPRVVSGAPVPGGADTVVRIEDTDGGADAVVVTNARDAGRNVRPAGEDMQAGSVVLAAGARLAARQIAMLAAVGAATVQVHRRPRVAVISTGDELVGLDRFDEVRAGKRIVSSNSYGLAAAVRSCGADSVDFGIVRDNRDELRAAVERAAACDLMLTTAGVSVGDADYVRDTIDALGGRIDFWRVRMRPGSPLAFGEVRGTPWLGLPGNPVSALVTFELFARPAIRRLLGDASPFASNITVTCDEAMTLAPSLTHFVRVRLTRDAAGSLRARTSGPQASNILSSLARADALMIVPPDRDQVRVGETFEAILL